MCGIAGYLGPRKAVEVVFDLLKRLEYRGYDSAGIAYPDHGEIKIIKKAGKLSELGRVVAVTDTDVRAAMGHSRWATHGAPTDTNAHPHFDKFEEVSIIHNGIIENYLELREELMARGHVFRSQTDTEVAAHVIGEEFAKGVPLEEAVRLAVKRLRGAYAIVVMAKREEGKLVATRNASPLVIGLGDGENLLSSDIAALLPYTKRVVIVEENDIAILTKDSARIMDGDARDVSFKVMDIEWDVAAAERGGYEHFMLKEINEQPEVIRQALAGRIDEKNRIRFEQIFSDNVWNEIDRINIISCGTAYHAGLMGKHLFEKVLRLPCDVYYSSEFRYGDPVLSPKSLAIFISQSGETADTLAALRLCKARRIRTLGIVNVMGSSIARECDRTIFTQAGPEISVASTKAYMAQVLVLTLLALYVVQVTESPGIRVSDVVNELRHLDEKARECLQNQELIPAIAEQISKAPLCFFLGRGADASVALEGALKLKEVAYIPTQEMPAGEMKHGPIALIQPGVVAIFGATSDASLDNSSIREKVISNMQEIKARGGTIVGITTADDSTVEKVAEYTLKVPHCESEFLSALLSVIPLQLLAYHVARLGGCEIDQPRNLAKSVTVE